MKVYKVGGAVRDKLLGLAVADTDWVVVGATAEAMREQGYRQVGKDFPVFLHPQTNEEYALARTERKTGPGHRGFTLHADPGVTLEADLQRRDLTINAIAEAADGTLIDPYHGRADLQAGILRHISPAFAEDPLRVLRVARFAARFDFAVADETLQLMRDIVASGELPALSPERVWAELEKTLASAHPVRGFEVLRACGALAVLLPEVDRLFGVPQPEQYHPEIDTGVHIMLVLDQAAARSDDPLVRFAALTHDLGKGTTPTARLPSHHGHEARGAKLVTALCARLRVPNTYRDLARLTAEFHTHVHRALELRAETMLKVIKACDALRRPARFARFLCACEADFHGRPGYEQRAYPQSDRFRAALAAAQAVDSRELAAQHEGAALGKAIDSARTRAISTAMAQRTD